MIDKWVHYIQLLTFFFIRPSFNSTTPIHRPTYYHFLLIALNLPTIWNPTGKKNKQTKKTQKNNEKEKSKQTQTKKIIKSKQNPWYPDWVISRDALKRRNVCRSNHWSGFSRQRKFKKSYTTSCYLLSVSLCVTNFCSGCFNLSIYLSIYLSIISNLHTEESQGCC